MREGVAKNTVVQHLKHVKGGIEMAKKKAAKKKAVKKKAVKRKAAKKR
jgi:hypothetical protein